MPLRTILCVSALTLAISLATATATVATEPGSVQEGIAAYEAGDYETAFRFLLPYAEEGIPEAQAVVGLMLAFGQGIQANAEAGRAWVQMAYSPDRPFSAYALALVVREHGSGGADAALACDLFEEAMKAGIAGATTQFGLCFYDGDGRPGNPSKAFELVYQEAVLGNVGAILILAAFHIDGVGVERNTGEAYAWLLAAQSLGSSKVGPSLDRIEKIVTQTDKDYAQERVRELLNLLPPDTATQN